MANPSSMTPLDQWDLAPGEAISQSPPKRTTKTSRPPLCPGPSLDTEQFYIDAAASLVDSPSLDCLREFDLAQGETLSESPPHKIRRCSPPQCPPPTLDTQEFLNEYPDECRLDDPLESCYDVPDSVDSATCNNMEEGTTSRFHLGSRAHTTSPVPSPPKKRILLTSSSPHSREDPEIEARVYSPPTVHDVFIPSPPKKRIVLTSSPLHCKEDREIEARVYSPPTVHKVFMPSPPKKRTLLTSSPPHSREDPKIEARVYSPPTVHNVFMASPPKKRTLLTSSPPHSREDPKIEARVYFPPTVHNVLMPSPPKQRALLTSSPPHSREDSKIEARVYSPPTIDNVFVPSPPQKRISLTASPPHGREDPNIETRVYSPSTVHNVFDSVNPNQKSNEASRSELKEGGSSESSTVSQHGEKVLCELSPAEGCKTMGMAAKRAQIEKSPHGYKSGGWRKVLSPMSPNWCRDSSVTTDAIGVRGNWVKKGNGVVAGDKGEVGSTLSVAVKQKFVLKAKQSDDLKENTCTVKPNSSTYTMPGQRVKIQSSLDGFSTTTMSRSRDCNLSSKASEWRNPRDGKKLLDTKKQISLDRWRV